MATIERSLKRSTAAVKKLAVTVPSTVKAKTVRINKKGDTYATAIYKSSNGNYMEIAEAFDGIASTCNEILKSSSVDAIGLKTELTNAKKKSEGRSKWAKERRKDCQDAYLTTKDIYNMIHK